MIREHPDPFANEYRVFAVDLHESINPASLRCVHDCQRIIQICRKDGTILYELCELNAETLTKMMLEALDDRSGQSELIPDRA